MVHINVTMHTHTFIQTYQNACITNYYNISQTYCKLNINVKSISYRCMRGHRIFVMQDTCLRLTK